ncbi:MAG: DUF5696 domain-containing protein [Oscillospiraceae bacterium]|jgi:hypothetical protein|nr:DUF5696 domain-containing protein [Oscillospiraceae bacterium]
MKLGTKLVLGILGIAALVVAVYQGYLHVYYRMYDGYKQYMDGERGAYYEEGHVFRAIPGGGNVPGMDLVAENEYLELYTNVETTNVALYDKRTGFTEYVCPPDADNDPIASSMNKSIMKSPLTIEFYNARRTSGRYNVYDYAIKDGQVEVESIGNGLRYIYTLGDMSVATGLVPLYIHIDRLEHFLKRIENARERELFASRYIESSVAPEGFMELREGAKTVKVTREMEAILREIGYTEEDLLEDSLASGVEGAVRISFEVPLEYRLDGDSLVVSVPTSRIVENGGARIDKIHIMRFFGAAGTDEDGYMLVPNGSGSLIHFNNGKTHVEEYSQFIYGQDQMSIETNILGSSEMVRLPVFGIYKEGGGSIFAQIGEGQSLAQLTASVSGWSTSYNNILTSFIVRGSGTLQMFGATGNEGYMPIVENDIYLANLTVRYSFLTGEYDGYSGMARYYREQLEREGILGDRVEQGDIPLYTDLVGAALGTKFAFSIQYQGVIPLTTYDQAAEIVDIFHEAGISNQVVNYQGWFNRGYFHDPADRINPIRQLGNKREFEELSSKLEAQGGKLYADVLFQNVPWQSKRYSWEMENSRYYGGGLTGWWAAHICPCCYNTWSLGYPEAWQALISPKFLPRYVDAFAKRIDSYDVTGISLRDLGHTLHSDRKRTELIDREHALTIVEAQLGILVELGKDIMVSGGNLYSLRGADDLINVPLEHSDFFIVDEEIPFYQMVVHGYIPYAGYAINRTSKHDQTDIVLKLIEYGASPHFILTYEEASEAKYTGINHFYGTYYQNWTDTAIELYRTVNPILSRVSGSLIVKHEITPDGLRCVTYDNGVQILVNYTGAAITYEGVPVAARGYALREGVAA